MPLAIGARLGPYEIVAALGAGGMGEVYRAHDARLRRDVALKVLPEALADDPDRMARFQREAEVLASLNHPNIAHIYGIEERAIVMELVEGESPKGPLPFEEAWNIAAQIADALEYAHDRGVIHRDLKPANVRVTPDGAAGSSVKLLDFGLAKALAADAGLAPGEIDAANSPTVTMTDTKAGVILGTAAYMAPEQVKGKRLDKRADIWAWGVMLYELLTGEGLFSGEDAPDTLAKILTTEPDLRKAPARVRRLLQECVRKDPQLRLRDIGDAKRMLADPARDLEPVRVRSSRLVWPVLATGLAVVVVGLAVPALRHVREEPAPAAKLFFPLPNETFEPGRPPSTSISPDGRHVAVTGVVNGKSQLWLRDLDDPTPRIVAADGAAGSAFWAPDSHRMGFFAEGKLKKFDVTAGGPAVALADAQATTGGLGPWSGTWNADDVIVFGRITSALFRVPANGGTPAKVTQLDAGRREIGHFAPWFLPDGKHFLFVALSSDAENRGVFISDLDSGGRQPLLIEATRTIYVTPGCLLFVRDGTLMAQRFNAGTLQTTSDAIPVVNQIDSHYAGAGVTDGYFAASNSGVLVYTSGRTPTGVQLTWFDRGGNTLETTGAPGELGDFSLSPDETRIAFMRRDVQAGYYFLWIRDLAHGAESRLTTGRIPPLSGVPLWSPDGTRLFYRVGDNIVQKAANNTGAEEVVQAAANLLTDASRDGRFLFTITPKDNDISVVPLFGDRKPVPYLHTAFQKSHARLSPDGRWLAYQSNESNLDEIYVVSFPQPTERWQVSTAGGQAPVWSHDGTELYYHAGNGTIMAVDIKSGATLQFGVPKRLFDVHIPNVNVSFAVNSQGRFLMPVLVEQPVSIPMTVALNWTALLPKGR